MPQIQHILLVKLIPGSDSKKFCNQIQSLEKSCDTVVSINIGPTITTQRAQGFEIAAVIVLKDEDSLPIYLKSQPHLDVLKVIKPMMEKLIVLDIQMGTTLDEKS